MADATLPHSYDAEKAVLKGVLDNPDVRYALELDPGDFYDPRNREMWRVMVALDGVKPTVLTVGESYDDANYLFEVATLPEYVPPWEAEHHARIVRDRAVRRRLIEASARIAKRAFDAEADDAGPYAVNEVERAIERLGIDKTDTGKALADLFDKVEAWSLDPLEYGGVRGLPTGIKALDHLSGGLNPGELTIVAGRPSIGKSALCLDVARRVGLAGKKVAIFELEMVREAVLLRWASAMSGVEARKVKQGACPEKYLDKPQADHYATEGELARFLSAMAEIDDAARNFEIVDVPGLSATEIRLRSLGMGDLDLVVVDHCGIMAGARDYNAEVEGRKSEAMHNLAKEIGCPVILVLQLNRSSLSSKRPELHQLRASGRHEENADQVWALWRQDYYEDVDEDVPLEIICLKSREGPTATVKLRYEPEIHRFGEWYMGEVL